MKKITNLLFILALGALLLSGCQNDEPSGTSIFVDPDEELSSFDQWLLDNFINPYNVRLAYRIEDIETDFNYNVVPADLNKSKQMAVLLRHLWIEAYQEVAGDGIHFIRATIPKLMHLIGSPEYNPNNGTIRLGQAEGGMKITITDINSLDPENIMDQEYFGTIHHEFAHILHQTKDYPVEFNDISAADYLPDTWFNRTEEDFLPLGFITAYAGSQNREDFVELISRYVTWPRTEWDRRLTAAGASGRDKIEQKLEIVRAYLRDSWDIDLEELHNVVQRRVSEIGELNLDNLDF